MLKESKVKMLEGPLYNIFAYHFIILRARKNKHQI